MDAFHPDEAPHRIRTVHRLSAAALWGFLLVVAAVRGGSAASTAGV